MAGVDLSQSLLTSMPGGGPTGGTISRVHDSTLGIRSPLDGTEIAYASKVPHTRGLFQNDSLDTFVFVSHKIPLF